MEGDVVVVKDAVVDADELEGSGCGEVCADSVVDEGDVVAVLEDSDFRIAEIAVFNNDIIGEECVQRSDFFSVDYC